MGENEGVCVSEQCAFENFAGVNERGIQGSPADKLHAGDLVLGVEVENVELFLCLFVHADYGAREYKGTLFIKYTYDSLLNFVVGRFLLESWKI